jgi:hypothetical protein
MHYALYHIQKYVVIHYIIYHFEFLLFIYLFLKEEDKMQIESLLLLWDSWIDIK